MNTKLNAFDAFFEVFREAWRRAGNWLMQGTSLTDPEKMEIQVLGSVQKF